MFQYRQIISSFEGKIIVTVAIVVVLWLIRYISVKLLNRNVKNIHGKIVNEQLSRYLTILVGIALIIPVWLEWFTSVFTVVSVIAVAVVLVTKDLLVNLLAHAVIVWRGLFSVGDRIQILEHIGNVVQIGPMYLTLAEIGGSQNEGHLTGRIIKLPNSMVLTTPVMNYSRGIAIIWSELHIEVEPASNWKKAQAILQEIGDRHSAKIDESDVDDMLISVEEALSIHSRPVTSAKLEKGIVVLQLRYSYRLENKLESETRIWSEIIDRFGTEEDIELVRESPSGLP